MTALPVSQHLQRPLDPTFDAASDPATADATLFAALVTYLADTSDQDAVRLSIRRWSQDVERAGRQPEDVLIQFKARLLDAAPSELNAEEEQLLHKRELISMSIEEYIHDELEHGTSDPGKIEGPD